MPNATAISRMSACFRCRRTEGSQRVRRIVARLFSGEGVIANSEKNPHRFQGSKPRHSEARCLPRYPSFLLRSHREGFLTPFGMTTQDFFREDTMVAIKESL